MARDSFRRSHAAPAPAHPNPAHALAGKAQRIYERIYCQRGEVENRIKELFDVALDRTSCSRFLANQLRVLLAASAYMLLQELRLAARRTAWARAQ